jgi:hypothetical protein
MQPGYILDKPEFVRYKKLYLICNIQYIIDKIK